MTIEQMVVALVGGVFTIAILSLILAPNSPAPQLINGLFSGFTGLVTAAKARP